MTINFEHITTNGIRLHTALAGPKDGDPVFLLHGFPDAWFGWEAQIESLADSGFRVITPDQRGYNLSDKPKGVASYQMNTLVDDILGLADALGYERFHLWGQQDPHISYEMAPLSVALCDDGRLVTFEDADHWVLHDKPEKVSQCLIEHFS